MNKIKQHRPAYFEGFENETVKFSTTEELLNIPFVKNFSEGDPDFYQFSVDGPFYPGDKPLLMCERHGGREWWVVGYLESLDGVTLPKWDHDRAIELKKEWDAKNATGA